MILHNLRTGTSRVSSLGKIVPEDIEPCSNMGHIYEVDCSCLVPLTMGPDSKLRWSNGEGSNRMPQGELKRNIRINI